MRTCGPDRHAPRRTGPRQGQAPRRGAHGQRGPGASPHTEPGSYRMPPDCVRSASAWLGECGAPGDEGSASRTAAGAQHRRQNPSGSVVVIVPIRSSGSGSWADRGRRRARGPRGRPMRMAMAASRPAEAALTREQAGSTSPCTVVPPVERIRGGEPAAAAGAIAYAPSASTADRSGGPVNNRRGRISRERRGAMAREDEQRACRGRGSDLGLSQMT